MKKIKFLLILVVVAFAVSCNQEMLDNPKTGSFPDATYYEGDEAATSALAALYFVFVNTPSREWNDLQLNLLYCLNNRAGETTYTSFSASKDKQMIQCFQTDPANMAMVSDAYESLYLIVFYANKIIDNFADGTTQIQKNAVAQARVARACCYYFLITMFGTPPIVEHAVKNLEDAKVPNSTTEEAWAFYLNDLELAINSGALESKKSLYDQDQVCFTKEFALALQGRGLVFTKKYEEAKVSLKQIMESGLYALLPQSELQTKFSNCTAGRHNCESLFEVNLVWDPTNPNATRNSSCFHTHLLFDITCFDFEPDAYWTRGLYEWRGWYPDYSFVRDMLANEGTSPRFKAWLISYEDLLDGGLKPIEKNHTAATQEMLDASSSSPLTPRTDLEREDVYPSGVMTESCGFYIRKWLINFDTDIQNKNHYMATNDVLVMRYAEVLLLYAEACAMLGETGGDGLAALNAIAERAGAPTYSTLNLNNVKNERKFELFCEGNRLYDLIRWGDAKEVLKDNHAIRANFYGYKPGKSRADISADGKNIFDVYDIRLHDMKAILGYDSFSFKEGRDEYLPFPETELASNPNLRQNPGY